ncbi:shikimate dehydrogenase [Rhodoluna sp.]|uniref:shikimate dehydrogenase n=1 Tax=Rhodoluna sp. TaxID=1969481 RepID=UPI0025F8D87A|nr:shikimate dehydrogenase [Rhodoluna sp.]
MSKKFAVLGSPIEHSKSPAIHLAAYRVLGTDWEYGRAEVKKGALRTFIGALQQQWNGFSVTMPLKEEAFRFANQVDELAAATKAVNTLEHREDGTWFGYNTDVFGIMQAVRQVQSNPPKKAVVIGSGATATSALVAISKLNPSCEVLISARNSSTRKSTIAFAKSIGLKAKRSWSISNSIAGAQLTVSTVPAQAMDDLAVRLERLELWKPGGMLLDVAYNPWPSKLATVFAARGAGVASGLEMLIWQAIAQIRIFTFSNPSQELPNEIAVLEAMRISVSESNA